VLAESGLYSRFEAQIAFLGLDGVVQGCQIAPLMRALPWKGHGERG
jgi:hypothetical protein